MKKNEGGFVLPIVVAILVVILIMMPAIVRWVQIDSSQMVRDVKRTVAFNLAEAAMDRGQWKLETTTTTWTTAEGGTVIAGYNFDTTYTDNVTGGTYRIRFSSGPGAHQVTIWGEGRDPAGKETRSVQEVVQNQTIYSALMSRGNVTWAKGLGVYWGPIISQGDITLTEDAVAGWYFPRKYSKGTVIGTAANPRDTNGLAAPNTDNVEWWTQYAGVPSLPILDFAALKSSAQASGTYNIYGCRSTQGGAGSLGHASRWDTRASCSSSGSHLTHFGNPWSHLLSARLNPNTDYVWYWEGDVTLSGAWCGSSPCNQSTGLRGTFIIRGSLTIDTPGEYNYTGPVPTNAAAEQNKLTKTTFDTGASNEYPADNGLHLADSTFNFGTETWCQPLSGSCGWRTTVGLRGFTYVANDLTILQFMDFNGAVWVNGAVSASGGTNTAFCGIFYNDQLKVPALNVILIRQSWNEVAPSQIAWP